MVSYHRLLDMLRNAMLLVCVVSADTQQGTADSLTSSCSTSVFVSILPSTGSDGLTYLKVMLISDGAIAPWL